MYKLAGNSVLFLNLHMQLYICINVIDFCFSWKVPDNRKQTKPAHYKKISKMPVIKFRFVINNECVCVIMWLTL